MTLHNIFQIQPKIQEIKHLKTTREGLVGRGGVLQIITKSHYYNKTAIREMNWPSECGRNDNSIDEFTLDGSFFSSVGPPAGGAGPRPAALMCLPHLWLSVKTLRFSSCLSVLTCRTE
uniref:Uncharacterized protein n=1 Tax=Gasterosteus aculeatus TaxID=69293 RepID=G3NPH5_GASAC